MCPRVQCVHVRMRMRRDRSGTLELRELMSLCRQVADLSMPEVGFLQALLDSDMNGRISLAEFVEGVKSSFQVVDEASRST